MTVRGSLVALAAFVALGALPVGVQWMIRPDGSTVGMPIAVLSTTPFGDFRLPGALLTFVVGGSQVTAGLLLALGRGPAQIAALAAGAILAVWIAVQVALIGFATFWQPLMGAAAVAELALAWRLGR